MSKLGVQDWNDIEIPADTGRVQTFCPFSSRPEVTLSRKLD